MPASSLAGRGVASPEDPPPQTQHISSALKSSSYEGPQYASPYGVYPSSQLYPDESTNQSSVLKQVSSGAMYHIVKPQQESVLNQASVKSESEKLIFFNKKAN